MTAFNFKVNVSHASLGYTNKQLSRPLVTIKLSPSSSLCFAGIKSLFLGSRVCLNSPDSIFSASFHFFGAVFRPFFLTFCSFSSIIILSYIKNKEYPMKKRVILLGDSIRLWGYGTKLHYEAVDKYGLCEEHRKSFFKKYYDAKQK